MNKNCDKHPDKQRSVLTAEKLASDIMYEEVKIGCSLTTSRLFVVNGLLSFISLMFGSKNGIWAVIFACTIMFMVILWIIAKIEIYNKRKEYSKKILSGDYQIIACRIQKKDRDIGSDPIDHYIEFKWKRKNMSWGITQKRYYAIEGNEIIYLVVFNHHNEQEIVMIYWEYEWILHPEIQKKLEYVSS